MTELRTAVRGSSAVAVLTSLFLTMGLGASASAAMVDLERVASATVTNSANKRATATCPAGKRLVGTGGDVTEGLGDVLIDGIRPNAALTSVTVSAREAKGGTTADWYVQALAVCATAPPGLVLVLTTSTLSSANKSVAAVCPAGTRVLGVGGGILVSDGQVFLDGVRPAADLTRVTVNALEDDTGYSSDWSLTAYAICASPVAGLERVAATSTPDSSNPRVHQVSCPATKRALSAGGEINSTNGQVVLDAIFPTADLVSAGIGAWEDHSGNTGNWSVTAYAICAATAAREVATSDGGPVNGGVKTDCVGGRRLTGMGAEQFGGFGRVAIITLFPDLDDDSGTDAFGRIDQTPAALAWTIRGYAICATPLPGLEVVDVLSESNSAPVKFVAANCPPGKVLISAGGSAFSFDRELVLTGLIPSAGGVTAVGFEDADGYDDDWLIWARALCALPPPGHQIVLAHKAVVDDEVASATAKCPAGKNLLGTGMNMYGDDLSVLDDLRPNAGLTAVTATSYMAAAGQTPDGGAWSTDAYAICANP